MVCGVHSHEGSGIALTKGDLPGRMNKPHCKRLRQHWNLLSHTRARVAELADALRSGRSDRKVVEVRVLSRAPIPPTNETPYPSASQKPTSTMFSHANLAAISHSLAEKEWS